MVQWRDRLGMWLACMFAVTCCATILPAHAVTLRTAAQEGTEPKFIAAGGERIAGMCVDLFRAIEQLDPELQIVGDQSWKPLIRAYSELEHGQLDLACAVQRIGERERRFHFIGPPLYNNEYHFLARISDPIRISSWDDVRQLAPDNTVLINRGFAAGDIIRAQGGIPIDDSATNQVLNLQKLVAGRGRLFFHRGRDLRKLLERTGNSSKVRVLPQVMLSSPVYFATSKQLAPDSRDRLERALFQLEKSGELDRLIRKWD
ncbi:substrate-binding periplasmic protein [Duganella qianjiadongensis]|uniref:Transporter substrate-binding domain-containing protein n=1 Tax=Duganella qianjiadongensis TaxID=2692176 RepID=A0ABW9VFZ8_9BURK|nr:ABC transporter substrate-binding protein [Duganella qianjiadongensis]MYM38533.1 transporter substrate-binding domain-containing protein [Duganella qianjiadongensis]